MQSKNFSSFSEFDDFQNRINKIKTALHSQDFFDYLAKKSREVVDKITAQNLNIDEEQKYTHTYRTNHNVKVNFDEIVISNETIIPVDSINPDIAMNYPNGFDLAKAVEYGTGIVGSTSQASELASERGWAYMVNTERDYNKPWFYMDENGELWWTKGMSGKLIYYKSKLEIEKNLYDWIADYIEQIK